jgi:hypothetical protein
VEQPYTMLLFSLHFFARVVRIGKRCCLCRLAVFFHFIAWPLPTLPHTLSYTLSFTLTAIHDLLPRPPHPLSARRPHCRF